MTQFISDEPLANEPEPPIEPSVFCDVDNCVLYTEEEHDAVMAQACALTNALFVALDAYSQLHPETSYDVILHALDCMAYCIKAQMNEEPTDA